jgi:hypothetical protein
MTDDRYTVDDPPGEGEDVWIARAYRQGAQYSVWSHGGFLLENRCLHRTEELAQAHARRMLMVDEILEVLEMLIDGKLINGDGGELAQWVVKRVIAKARGEVAG